MNPRIFLILTLLIPCLSEVQGQSTYQQAVRLFEQADSIREAEDNKLERDHDNYRLAIRKFEEARDLFNEVDSTYFGFRCEVGVLKCEYYLDDLVLENVQNFKNRLQIAGVQDSLLGQAYYHEGACSYEKYDYREAIRYFMLASEDYGKIGNTKFLVNAHWFLGLSYRSISDMEKASENYSKALALLESLPSTRFRIRSEHSLLKNSAIVYSRMGFSSKAWNHFFRSLDLLEKDSNLFSRYEKARFYYTLGTSLNVLGNYDQSLLYLRKSLELNDDFETRNAIGLLWAEIGEPQKSIAIFQKINSCKLNEPQRKALYNNLGWQYVKLSLLDSAEKYLDYAVQINLKLEDWKSLANNYGNLTELYLLKEDYRSASLFLKKMLDLDPSRFNIVSRLKSQMYMKQNQYDLALTYAISAVYSEGNEVLKTVSARNPNLEVLGNCKWLAEVYNSPGLKKDLEVVRSSISFLDDYHEVLTHWNLGENQIALTESSLLSPYELGIANSVLYSERKRDSDIRQKAFAFSEKSKIYTLKFAKRISEAKALVGLPESVIDQERNLKIKENYFRSQLSRLSTDDNQDTTQLVLYQNRLSEIQQSQDSLENVIRIEYPRYHQLRYQDVTLSVAEVQERLKPSQAFIEYFAGDTTSFVFTITKDDYQVNPIQLDEDTLITQYREYFEPEKFKPDQQEVSDLSYQIYQNYLEPALGSLDTTITELIVVPDGKLSYVPFDILLTEPVSETSNDQPYLLRDYQIHYTYSASLYFNDFTTLSTKDEYLAFAPVYEHTLSDTSAVRKLGNFRNQITSLQHNREEVSYISQNFKGLGFFGESANERNFKDKVDEYGVLHLAMHTIVDDEDPMNSKLVFSNSKDSIEDDMLHAFEIYNMEIPSQLTVLSACETGFGKLAKGEGALSLARAFSYAGSPSVVMSHWPVDDQTTAELMRYFYDYLSEGLTKSEALRRAKLDYLGHTHSVRSHPFFWGSFVVMGDDSPVHIERLSKNRYWIWVMALVMITGLLLLPSLRRILPGKKTEAIS